VIFSVVDLDGTTGIEVTARDRGPGIANVEQALADHFSTGGTLGLGLPGVRRLVDDFTIESQPGQGTEVTIRIWKE
jgi:serine/threonine-protein kinase RsbT